MTSPHADGEREWFDEEPVRFECTQCGACCTGSSGFVLFSRKEGERIANRLGISYAEFHDRYTHETPAGRSLRESVVIDEHGRTMHDCIFLDRQALPGRLICSLYEDRPTQCRTFPYWPENVSSRRAWRAVARACEGIGRGNFVPSSEIRIQRATQEQARRDPGHLEPGRGA
jgi:Fe-S-cluster containining protein